MLKVFDIIASYTALTVIPIDEVYISVLAIMAHARPGQVVKVNVA